MTRLAVLLPLAAVIWVAFPLAIAKFLRGPRTEEREALGSDICSHGVCPDECPSCRPMPPVGCCPPAAAGDEHDVWCPSQPMCPMTRDEFDAAVPVVPGRPQVQWEADLERFYSDYDTYRTELRLPGERAS